MSAHALLHYVSLDDAGGVELQFVEFLQAARRLAGVQQAVVACGQQINPLVADRLAGVDAPVTFEKYAGPLKLPKWPPAIRAARQRMLTTRYEPDVVLIWNRLRDSLKTLDAAGDERCIYWERGASWFAHDTRAKRRFLERVPLALCNSHAARRMLELRWGYAGQIRVIHNALRPSLAPPSPVVRQLPVDRPLRLGVAARLVPIKGVALAVQTLARLVERGQDVCLDIAGDGPERARLETLATQLGLAGRVRFLGLVADMSAFYGSIDLLLHPALREPFGQIVVEAGAYGVPAVAAGVDGLPEVVDHDRTGCCVTPSLALADYGSLGGGADDLPPFVYCPDTDTLDEPRLVDPARMADVVQPLLTDSDRYTAMSAAVIADVAERFDFDRHVLAALAAISANIGRPVT